MRGSLATLPQNLAVLSMSLQAHPNGGEGRPLQVRGRGCIGAQTVGCSGGARITLPASSRLPPLRAADSPAARPPRPQIVGHGPTALGAGMSPPRGAGGSGPGADLSVACVTQRAGDYTCVASGAPSGGPSGGTLFFGDRQGGVTACGARSGAQRAVSASRGRGDDGVTAVTLASGGTDLWTGTARGRIAVLEVASGAPRLPPWAAHTRGGVTALVALPAGAVAAAASAGGDGAVNLWSRAGACVA